MTTEISIHLERNLQPHHLPFILADGVGLFEEQDLSVDLVPPNKPFPVPPRETEADLALGLTSPIHLVCEHLENGSLMGIGRVYDNEAALLLAEHLEFEEPSELSGPLSVATYGLPKKVVKQALTSVTTTKGGSLEPDSLDVRTSETPLEELIEGGVDLLFPAWLVPDVVQAREQGARTWYFPNLGLPDTGDLILVGHQELVNSRPNEAQALLGAIHKAQQRLLDDPGQARQLLNAHPVTGQRNYPEALVDSSFEGFTDNLGQNSDCYRQWGEFFEEEGIREAYLDMDQIMDERFIPFDAMDLEF